MEITEGAGPHSREVGKIFIEEMKRRGTSQAFVIRSVGISRTGLHRILNGQRELTLASVVGICAALELSSHEVMAEAVRRVREQNANR